MIVLIIVLIDERVFWYESLAMVICYGGYIVVMVFNKRLEQWAEKTKNKVFIRFSSCFVPMFSASKYPPHNHTQCCGQGVYYNTQF